MADSLLDVFAAMDVDDPDEDALVSLLEGTDDQAILTRWRELLWPREVTIKPRRGPAREEFFPPLIDEDDWFVYNSVGETVAECRRALENWLGAVPFAPRVRVLTMRNWAVEVKTCGRWQALDVELGMGYVHFVRPGARRQMPYTLDVLEPPSVCPDTQPRSIPAVKLVPKTLTIWLASIGLRFRCRARYDYAALMLTPLGIAVPLH